MAYFHNIRTKKVSNFLLQLFPVSTKRPRRPFPPAFFFSVFLLVSPTSTHIHDYDVFCVVAVAEEEEEEEKPVKRGLTIRAKNDFFRFPIFCYFRDVFSSFFVSLSPFCFFFFFHFLLPSEANFRKVIDDYKK